MATGNSRPHLGGSDCASLLCLSAPPTVVALFPGNGTNWNDYVKFDEPNKAFYEQDNAPCIGDEVGHHSGAGGCLHGGELRTVDLAPLASCDGLTFGDELEAFGWICDDTSGTANLYSLGLKEDRGLADLLDPDGLKLNRISVSSGACTYRSAPARWWNNFVTPVPSAEMTRPERLTIPGAIYTIDQDIVESGFSVEGDSISLVTLGTATYTYADATDPSCSLTTGEATGATAHCMVTAGSQKFLWIEGNFAAATGGVDADYGVFLHTTGNSVIQATNISLPVEEAIALESSFYNRLSNVRVFGARDKSVELIGSDYNIVHRLSMSSDANGLMLAAVSNTAVVQVQSNGSRGIDVINVVGGLDNVLTQMSVFNNHGGTGDTPFWIGANQTTVLSIVAHHNWVGVVVLAPGNNISMGKVVSGTNYTGSVTTHNFMHWKNPGPVFNYFDYLMQPGGGDCSPTTACDIFPDTITKDNLAESSFVAKVTLDDSVSPDDNQGVSEFAAIGEYFALESFFRSWSLDGGDYPTSDNRGSCAAPGQQCRIWDWRLVSTDTHLLNRGGDGRNENGEFVAGQDCPGELHGNESFTDMQTNSNTFLTNAYEIVTDPLGDNDGLCEANEACIYAPNIGAYQGEGDYTTRSCTFTDGVVSAVTMYAYPDNGITP